MNKNNQNIQSKSRTIVGRRISVPASPLLARQYARGTNALLKRLAGRPRHQDCPPNQPSPAMCSGQSTTEYAILVGVLVVIAMVAIVAFKGKVQELWDAIAQGINAL